MSDGPQEDHVERPSMRLRDAGGEVLPSQSYPLPHGLRGISGRSTSLEGRAFRRRARDRYDSNAVCRALRVMPAGPGAAQRLAELPTWDGVMRYDINLLKGHQWTGTSEEVTLEAAIALYDMARGNMEGAMGERMQHDPDDPLCVRLDILKQAHPLSNVLPGTKPWGYR